MSFSSLNRKYVNCFAVMFVLLCRFKSITLERSPEFSSFELCFLSFIKIYVNPIRCSLEITVFILDLEFFSHINCLCVLSVFK